MSVDPTPHSDVNATLDKLLSGVQAVLGSHFVGMYLYGSLASGDFNPASSDIDFVVVTDGELPDETVNTLGALHTRLAVSGLKWAPKLEGAYVPQRTLRRHQPGCAPCPQINEGNFYVEFLGDDWVIQRDVLHRQGVTLAGPPPQSLIDPVAADDLRQSVLDVFHNWWEPMLDNSAFLQRDDYRAFAVLSMCRTLYTLQYGLIASKPVSARWAQQVIGQHANLIEKAMQWHNGSTFDHLDETLALIHYAQEEIQGFEQDMAND